MTTITRLVMSSLVVSASLLACSAAPEDPTGESESDITRTNAIGRADQWVGAKLHYCQAANHQRDYDSACSTYCNRTDNSAWNPYRSDCSGLISWAWALPAPGRITTQFAPFQNDISHTIAASSLQPGDAVNTSEHIILFKKWDTHGSVATFIEEPGCSSPTPYAHEFTSTVSVNGSSIYISYEGRTFTAIRYDGISNAPPPPPPSPPPAPKPPSGAGLSAGEGLLAGHGMRSGDGRFSFDMQADGNLVLYLAGHALWASGTYGKPAHEVLMQSDGNLVVYEASGVPLWDSGTAGHPGAHLVVQNDGNVVIYDNGAIWASHTSGH